MKTVVSRSTSGTSNLMPPAVYTAQWPLLATDEYNVLHDPSVSSFNVDDNQGQVQCMHLSVASWKGLVNEQIACIAAAYKPNGYAPRVYILIDGAR